MPFTLWNSWQLKGPRLGGGGSGEKSQLFDSWWSARNTLMSLYTSSTLLLSHTTHVYVVISYSNPVKWDKQASSAFASAPTAAAILCAAEWVCLPSAVDCGTAAFFPLIQSALFMYESLPHPALIWHRGWDCLRMKWWLAVHKQQQYHKEESSRRAKNKVRYHVQLCFSLFRLLSVKLLTLLLWPGVVLMSWELRVMHIWLSGANCSRVAFLEISLP